MCVCQPNVMEVVEECFRGVELVAAEFGVLVEVSAQRDGVFGVILDCGVDGGGEGVCIHEVSWCGGVVWGASKRCGRVSWSLYGGCVEEAQHVDHATRGVIFQRHWSAYASFSVILFLRDVICLK